MKEHMQSCPQNPAHACQHCNLITNAWSKASHESACASNPAFTPQNCACCGRRLEFSEQERQQAAQKGWTREHKLAEHMLSCPANQANACMHCGSVKTAVTKAAHESTCTSNPRFAPRQCPCCKQWICLSELERKYAVHNSNI